MTASKRLKRVSVQVLAMVALSGLALGANATAPGSFTIGEKAKSLVASEKQMATEAGDLVKPGYVTGLSDPSLASEMSRVEQPFDAYVRVPRVGYVRLESGQV